jgi:hypothetical protein
VITKLATDMLRNNGATAIHGRLSNQALLPVWVLDIVGVPMSSLFQDMLDLPRDPPILLPVLSLMNGCQPCGRFGVPYIELFDRRGNYLSEPKAGIEYHVGMGYPLATFLESGNTLRSRIMNSADQYNRLRKSDPELFPADPDLVVLAGDRASRLYLEGAPYIQIGNSFEFGTMGKLLGEIAHQKPTRYSNGAAGKGKKNMAQQGRMPSRSPDRGNAAYDPYYQQRCQEESDRAYCSGAPHVPSYAEPQAQYQDPGVPTLQENGSGHGWSDYLCISSTGGLTEAGVDFYRDSIHLAHEIHVNNEYPTYDSGELGLV